MKNNSNLTPRRPRSLRRSRRVLSFKPSLPSLEELGENNDVLEKGTRVKYLRNGEEYDAIVINVHYEDNPPYYTIKLLETNQVIDTERSRLIKKDRQPYNNIPSMLNRNNSVIGAMPSIFKDASRDEQKQMIKDQQELNKIQKIIEEYSKNTHSRPTSLKVKRHNKKLGVRMRHMNPRGTSLFGSSSPYAISFLPQNNNQKGIYPV